MAHFLEPFSFFFFVLILSSPSSSSFSSAGSSSGYVVDIALMGGHLVHLGMGKGRKEAAQVPRGCVAVRVEQRRFVVPLNHPLFRHLLKEAEEEYGFDQKGTIALPCAVAEFRYVEDLISREGSSSSSAAAASSNHHGHFAGCFKG